MDFYFFIVYFLFQYASRAFLELWFFSHFLDCRPRPVHYLIYILLSYGLVAIEVQLSPTPISLFFLTTYVLLLAGMGMLFHRKSWFISVLTSLLTVTLLLLADGFTTPITLLTQSFLVLHPLLSELPMFLSLILLFLSYRFVLSWFPLHHMDPDRCFAIFFIPALSVITMECFLFNQIYEPNFRVPETNLGIQWHILLLQLFGYFSLFCVLYTFQKFSETAKVRMGLALLKQASETQQQYVREAQSRYEQTRSFRHDLQNHLSVLKGLINQGASLEAASYLEKLTDRAWDLSFPCHTGHPVLDILLGSKLGGAAQHQIRTECRLNLPYPCDVDDYDLCVIFSNAVDNAIKACSVLEASSRYLNIQGRQQGDFFLAEFENSCASVEFYPAGEGLGLSNIKEVALKYGGAVSAERGSGYFRISVLFISQRKEDRSQQSH